MIKFEKPLLQAQFQSRYKRFFADLVLPDGQKVTAHVPNTGSMKGLIEKPTEALLTYNPDPKRKLQYTLEALKVDNSWVGVHTGRPSQYIQQLFEQNLHPHWGAQDDFFPEIKISSETRLDGLIAPKGLFEKKPVGAAIFSNSSRQPLHFFEIKNVTMKHEGKASFPDAKSERAVKHLEELGMLIDKGHTAEILFTVQRTDCEGFEAAAHIHPAYSDTLKKMQRKGLKTTLATFDVQPEGVQLVNIVTS